MRVSWLIGWSASILVGAAVVRPITGSSATLAALASSEAAHVVAHLVLYAVLAVLALASRLSPWRAATLTLGVAVMQEGVQLIVADRAPGPPELFDLAVDTVAVIAVLLAFRLRRGVAARS